MTAKPLLPIFRKKTLQSSAAGASRLKTEETARTLSRCSSREARACLELTQAEKLNVLPLGLIHYPDGELLSVAAHRDDDPDVFKAIQFATGRPVKVIAVDPDALREAIFLAYRGDDRAVEENFQRAVRAIGEAPTSLAAAIEFRPDSGDAAKALASLFDYAISRGASDIHLIPLRDSSCIKLRLNGELLSSDASACSLQLHTQMLSRLKVLAGIDTTKRNVPQDGSFSIPVSSRTISARLSTMPTIHGEKAAIRLLGVRSTRHLKELGFGDVSLAMMEDALNASGGVLLFCGPTGSGKSTSMYAALEYLKSRDLHIVTIEDPVESVVEGVSQTTIREDLGIGYEVCLRAALRQDPDVILLGEIRDEVSARTAFQAALTGHLLLSTIHSRSAPEVFLRLAHLGVERHVVNQALTLVVSQRLLPVLCANCKVIDLESSARSRLELYRPVGCPSCDYSGFTHRAPITELLAMDDELRESLEKSVSIAHALNPNNYIPFQVSLDRLLKNGSISFSNWEEASKCLGQGQPVAS